MNTENNTNNIFTHKSVVKVFTEYVLYYQVSLGNIALETIGDPELTVKKLTELQLALEPDDMLKSLFEVLQNTENMIYLEKNLKIKAMLHALNDFVEADHELLNKERFLEMKTQSILDELFFNSQMKMQYLSEYAQMQKYYENLITEDFVTTLNEGITL